MDGEQGTDILVQFVIGVFPFQVDHSRSGLPVIGVQYIRVEIHGSHHFQNGFFVVN